MESLANAVTAFNDIYWYVVIALLVVSGVLFTVRTRAVQFRMLPEMIRSVLAKPTDEEKADGVSAFRAFTISAASRVGTGNVAGVAIAVVIGGPGAVFWMWLLAIFGGATAYIESALAQLYKRRGHDGFVGGPAYYIKHGLGQGWMAVLFAVMITLTYGFVFNAVQSNSISASVVANWGETFSLGGMTFSWPWVIGIGLAVLTGAVIFGGVRRLSAVTNVIVPVMASAYILVALFVVALNITEVPAMFLHIVRHALGLEQVAGAAVGMAMIMQGVRRGLFSNEAGMGSAPNAAATAAVSHPAKQGFVQSLGVYFDTLIVCSVTAFIILLSNPTYGDGEAVGMAVTQSALGSQVGAWAGPFLTAVIFFLAWSSVLGNTYYGEANIQFMAGAKAPAFITVFRVLVLLCVVGGALGEVLLVWSLADTFSALMATINLIAIIPLGGLAIKMLKDYEVQRKQGLDPTFHASSLPEAKGVELWREGETTAMRTVPGDPAGGEYWPGRQRRDRRTGGSHEA